MSQSFDQLGYVWLRGVVASELQAKLRGLLTDDARPGARIDAQSELFQTLKGAPFSCQLSDFLPDLALVRALSFNKASAGNWGVPWHQDRVIAVAEKQEVPGFKNWSCKTGQWHCEPPEAILKQMLFVRLFLDHCSEQSGAMAFSAGSHREGLVPADRAEALAMQCQVETEEAEPGDVLVLHMLTLHRSRPSSLAAPRRVLRLDYGPSRLPEPLRWVN